MNKTLLIATNNQNKLNEIKSLFKDLPFNVTSLKEQNIVFEVDETGTTFEENAILKATQYAKLANMLTLADDSGIEVDALDKRPGVYSARYSGENATDTSNMEKLLYEMKGVPQDKRQARYKVVFALADASGLITTAEGSMEGLVTNEPKGKHGFGYDPILFIPQFNKTAAQITLEQKNSISHRKQALEKLIPILKKQ